MRKIILLLFLLVPSCLLAQKTRVFTINFSEKEFSFEKNDDFLIIVSKDNKAVIWGDTLDPALPFVGVNILIDYADDYAGFSYKENETLVGSNVTIDYNPVILPTNIIQESRRSRQIIEYDKKSYPDENVQFTGVHMMDGYKFLTFVVCPFRYDADNKNLYLKKDISLNINLRSLSPRESPKSPGKNMREIVRDFSINGNEMDTLYPYSTRATVTTDTVSYKYIIITNEALKPSFEKLAHWKTIKGVRSKVITVEDCYDAHPNLTPQLAIKTVLANFYNNGMEYALLAGDTDIVPSQICYLPHWTDDTYDTPADLYYACLDTLNSCFSWDANGNNVYGEIYDNVDLAPEFILTRCSVSTLAEADIFVDRIIEYESSPKTDGWTKKMLSCGNIIHYYAQKNNLLISDSQYQGEYVYENGVQPYWDGSFFELFDTYSDHPDGANYQVTGDHFQTEFEKGYTFIDEFSHGWVNKWGFLEDWTLYKLDKASSLVNNGYSIITTTACYTNAFDKISTDFPGEEDYYTTCLSESFMRNPDSGILAYFGSSREGWNYISSYFDEKFYENLLSSNEKQFGRAAMLAKNAYISETHLTYYDDYRWLIMSINPLGDPEMSVFTQIPQMFNNVSVSFSNGNLSVSTGISDCTICISSAADFGDSYYRMYINANGVSLSDMNDDCYLCITKQGYIPYIARVGNSVYLQNEDIVRNLSVFSMNTYVGSNVNSSMTQGPVTIHKGKVINKSTGSITIQNDFEVKSGTELEIMQP